MMDELQRKCADILKRDFKRQHNLTVTDIMWPEGTEDIIVCINGKIWWLSCGSDDDNFFFTSSDGEHLTVEYSDEWLKVNEDGC